LKNISEPIFAADFFPTSYGFRPGKSVHGALEHLRLLLRPKDTKQGQELRLPYSWIVEGDIKGCFDDIDRHGPMEPLRRRVVDPNIALSVIDERYERHVLQRRIAPTRRDAAPPERRAKEARKHDKERGHTVMFPTPVCR
jgi:retron-type reverse transcriptase